MLISRVVKTGASVQLAGSSGSIVTHFDLLTVAVGLGSHRFNKAVNGTHTHQAYMAVQSPDRSKACAAR